jgi:hypothetical protein
MSTYDWQLIAQENAKQDIKRIIMSNEFIIFGNSTVEASKYDLLSLNNTPFTKSLEF